MKYQWDIEELVEASPGNDRRGNPYALVRLVRLRRMDDCWGRVIQQALDKQRGYPNICQTILCPLSWENAPFSELQVEL